MRTGRRDAGADVAHVPTQRPLDPDGLRQSRRMLNEDGLVDVALGFGLLFAALYVGAGPAWHVRLAGLAVAVPMVTVLVMGAMRRRLVYPRIGQARLPATGAVPGLSIILTAMFFIGLAAFIVLGRPGQGSGTAALMWLLRGFMLFAAALLLVMGARTRLARFYLHAGVIALCVLGAGLFVRSAGSAVMVMAGMPGVVLFVTGAITFVRFMRRYPRTP